MNYREEVLRTLSDTKNDIHDCLLHASLGMCGESGEFIDIIKKHRYYNKELNKQDLIKELGDIRWYLEVACYALGVTMEEVQQMNVDKLRKRYPEGFTQAAAIERKDVSE